MTRLALLFACTLSCALAAVAPAFAAAPKLTATASVQSTAAGPVLEVVVKSAKAATARTRPRSVSAKLGGATQRLKRVSGTKRRSVWRSKALTGAAAAALAGAVNRPLEVAIGTRAGKVKRRPALAAPAPAPVGPPVPGGAPVPPVPGGPAVPPPPNATPPAGTPPGITLTRDDAAAQNALAQSGDLLLERYLEQGSVTMTIARVFFYANGVFRF